MGDGAVGTFMDNGYCKDCDWSGPANGEHECIKPGQPRHWRKHEGRLYALAKDGPGTRTLTADDIAALRWVYRAIHEADSASSKLWSMLVRREIAPKAEIDGLLTAFNERPWWHCRPAPCDCDVCKEWDRQRDEDREADERERLNPPPPAAKEGE